MIPFNKPHVTGLELENLRRVLERRHLSGDGEFTKRCQSQIEQLLKSGKSLLTTSCTDALEMAAILCDIKPDDEVIVPSFTFVSTANAFALRGAHIRFIDSQSEHPNLDARLLDELITPRTKAVVPVHYAGMACDMNLIMNCARRHGLRVVEDAAQAIDSYFDGQHLGSIGDIGAFSFHETKNVMAGEGGSIHINDDSLIARAEIVREKGTNRSSFFRGEVAKYGWVDIGSSFLPSELTAAFLSAQLESIQEIQSKRRQLWRRYHDRLVFLSDRGCLKLPVVPPNATNNAHMYYVMCDSLQQRTALMARLKAAGVSAAFHYQSLHASAYFAASHDGRSLPNADKYTNCLLRLPLFFDLKDAEQDLVCETIENHFVGT